MAVAVDNTEEMINYLLVRWKKSDSTERARMLKWLQEAEDNIWNAGDWWFALAESYVTFANATATVAFATSITRVCHIIDSSGNVLDQIPYGTFYSLYRNSASTGTPQVWTVVSRASSGAITIRLWPTPSSTVTTNVALCKTQQATLTDASSSVSNVPREYRNAHLYYAQWNMALDEGQGEEAARWETRWKEKLSDIAAEDKRQRGEAPFT